MSYRYAPGAKVVSCSCSSQTFWSEDSLPLPLPSGSKKRDDGCPLHLLLMSRRERCGAMGSVMSGYVAGRRVGIGGYAAWHTLPSLSMMPKKYAACFLHHVKAWLTSEPQKSNHPLTPRFPRASPSRRVEDDVTPSYSPCPQQQIIRFSLYSSTR